MKIGYGQCMHVTAKGIARSHAVKELSRSAGRSGIAGPSVSDRADRAIGWYGGRCPMEYPVDMTTHPIDPLAAAHSAEHILSAVMQRDYGTGRSLETHLGARKSKCDYLVRRPLDEADVRMIEAAVNAEIEKDHSVSSFEIGREEGEGRYDMGKVPEGAKAIRIVQIGDLDAMPCVGAHVERTSQLGRFLIRSMTMKSEDVVRIRYALAVEEAR